MTSFAYRALPEGSAPHGDPAASIAAGEAALAVGDWAAARAGYETALGVSGASGAEAVLSAASGPPEAFDGLGRVLWWLGHPDVALMLRQRAYAGFRKAGDSRRAARIALWLAEEFGALHGNEAAAGGWLARAERLLRDSQPGAETGWLALTRSLRATDPEEAERLAGEALAAALEHADPDLELRALAALGAAQVSLGRVDEGLARYDEAMAGGTGGEPRDLATLGELYCSLLSTCELAGDDSRPAQWGKVIESFVATRGHLPLLSFCRCCCADVFTANGRAQEAEEQLRLALAELKAAGHKARCVHPAARLAERRVQQGRLEEAEQLVAGFEAAPEALGAAVSLRLARGAPRAAAALVERRLAEVGRGSLLAGPPLALLVQAQLAAGNTEAARAAAKELSEVARSSGRVRAQAAADMAAGRVALAEARADAARGLFERAADGFGQARLRLDAARARLALGRALAASSGELAADEVLTARSEFEQLGASREADEASVLLRELGVRGRAGSRDHGLLTRRETEVLRLLAEGLSNAEVGERLRISPKTAEHHVGRVLAKLELRSRAEAASYAARHLSERES